ncbi:hypothetical protein MHK_009377 [Candidatus Magnetomorum sp. HK-1]|nr:hypothetical protein MHK_009377 [Candidatus Magnetomorum sp. HK-1]
MEVSITTYLIWSGVCNVNGGVVDKAYKLYLLKLGKSEKVEDFYVANLAKLTMIRTVSHHYMKKIV